MQLAGRVGAVTVLSRWEIQQRIVDQKRREKAAEGPTHESHIERRRRALRPLHIRHLTLRANSHRNTYHYQYQCSGPVRAQSNKGIRHGL
ncbi:hypothetical protein MJO28_001946 [Puccinia striiformis f. sp. tritici]|uniref:Uncharacterized protein n=1 Tax=Puccinia striiformis f. sp. tritici TaxID=168172 RepID=A0ACC0EVI2_9BASI|nr:hypothetical protein MJO28_001946 [Puccinia striiformis f. sp. tritici]KAI7966274.1 hypothetical protein MJO29_002022 [Puccinia striiformis f. sp. tritici]